MGLELTAALRNAIPVRYLPSGAVSFLFTDIEGSTRLLSELGPQSYSKALARHRRLLREAFESHGGVEVDTQGDAFFFAFSDARAAVDAAEAGQAVLADGPIRVRMGVHTGEALATEGGYVGFEVHKGARVAAAGHGGQVVVSEATRVACGRELRPLGTHRLKDLTAPEPLWQIGEREFPPLKTLNQTNLPVQASPLIGREPELREAGALLRENRVVTLVGPGGSGKTRLGLQLAAEAVDDFPHGVWWVPLQALRDPTLLLPTIASTLGAQRELAEHLLGKRLLLVLDNMEQLVDAGGDLAELLSAADDVKMLVTSREPLHLAGERTYAVDPLPLRDAVALFVDRATHADPRSTVELICQRLDCLPLAVELAAARTTLLAPENLLVRLDQTLPLLTGGHRDAPERQRTLRDTIQWSYELLSDDEQQLFARLGVFAGSFELDAAQAVCDAGLDTLQSLVEKSLVRRWGSGRFGMLETIYEFARDRLLGGGGLEVLRQRHASHYVTVAEQADPQLRGRDQHAWRARLELDHDNLRAALSWSRDAGDTELGVRLVAALWRFWRTSNRLGEGTRMLDEFLRVGETAPALRARALVGASRLAMDRGDFVQSIALADEALVAAQAGGEPRDLAAATENLGLVLAVTELNAGSRQSPDTVKRALALLVESVGRFRALGDRVGTADALNNLGSALRDFGDMAQAAESLEEALGLQRDAGNAVGVAFVLDTLGYLALHNGELELARVRLQESLGLFYELGDVSRTGEVLDGLAAIAANQGQDHLAGTLWGAGAAFRAESGKEMEPSDRFLREEALSAVRTRLGQATLAEAWAEGAALAPQDAVALGQSSD
jgi:predicted ATPase/class 3 adenylate cyclase